MNNNITLTELEKATLKQGFSYGYAYDDWEDSFFCWGFVGKQERGAAASLVKKGIIEVFEDDGDTYVLVGEGYTKDDLADMCGAHK